MNEKDTLATELLHELKANAKRWFIAFIITLGLWSATIVGFIWYITLPPVEDTVTIENDDGNANYIGRDMNGELDNGENNSEKDTQGQNP